LARSLSSAQGPFAFPESKRPPGVPGGPKPGRVCLRHSRCVAMPRLTCLASWIVARLGAGAWTLVSGPWPRRALVAGRLALAGAGNRHARSNVYTTLYVCKCQVCEKRRHVHTLRRSCATSTVAMRRAGLSGFADRARDRRRSMVKASVRRHRAIASDVTTV